MIQIRRSEERGAFDHGWLKTKHSFSFSEYYDPKHMRFRSLRVINEDWVAPKAGFPTHAHQNMEIVTYVISGTLAHTDSLGNKGTIQAGEIQRMTAGQGIEHSEYNPDSHSECHLLQIWIFPSAKDLKPSWEQVEWRSQPLNANGMRLLASHTPAGGAAKIHQDVSIWHGSLKAGDPLTLALDPARGGWLQLVSGSLDVASLGQLRAGDGLSVENIAKVALSAVLPAEFLWFDLN